MEDLFRRPGLHPVTLRILDLLEPASLGALELASTALADFFLAHAVWRRRWRQMVAGNPLLHGVAFGRCGGGRRGGGGGEAGCGGGGGGGEGACAACWGATTTEGEVEIEEEAGELSHDSDDEDDEAEAEEEDNDGESPAEEALETETADEAAAFDALLLHRHFRRVCHRAARAVPNAWAGEAEPSIGYSRAGQVSGRKYMIIVGR